MNNITLSSDLYIISLKDDIIKDLGLNKLLKDKLVVHTSGSYKSEDLTVFSKYYGCFYPLQTFDKNNLTDISDVPFFIEANKRVHEDMLFNLAKSLSSKVQILNSEERKALHIVAVTINNFVNFTIGKAKQHAKHNNIDFSFLEPLLKETVKLSLENSNPLLNQTGPAKRGDENTIKNHISILEKDTEYKTLYTQMSELIYNHYNHEKLKL